MNTEQLIIIKPATPDELEMSLLVGKNTLILPSPLSQPAINTIFSVYRRYKIQIPSWRQIYVSIKDLRLEPIIEDIPTPDESEGKLFDLTLENGQTVKLLVRAVRIEVSDLVMVH